MKSGGGFCALTLLSTNPRFLSIRSRIISFPLVFADPIGDCSQTWPKKYNQKMDSYPLAVEETPVEKCIVSYPLEIKFLYFLSNQQCPILKKSEMAICVQHNYDTKNDVF